MSAPAMDSKTADARRVVSHQDWLQARRALLAREKELTHLRERIAEERRALPWEKVDKHYEFDTLDGRKTLAQLFGNHSQLVVYHFMFGPQWEQGCPSCSFWADNFNGIPVHLAHRDVAFTAISRAPLAKLQQYQRRMGWSFPWASSHGSDFNFDFQVSFTPEALQGKVFYNFEDRTFPSEEAPGISVFHRNADGEVFHTYSCYARGLDWMNGAYHYLDLVPKGRDEAGLPYTMAWLRRHDQYTD
jgi:predicted dithiol-disulfide oxidoreductase (DUF899 family)